MLIEVERAGICATSFELDHFRYRVKTTNQYELLKEEIANSYGTLLTELLIGGRPVASFTLDEPIEVNRRTVSVLELPSPKLDRTYTEGYEHIEFVVPNVFDLVNTYSKQDFDISKLNNSKNPTVSLTLMSGIVKFHETALEDLIYDEKKNLSKILY